MSCFEELECAVRENSESCLFIFDTTYSFSVDSNQRRPSNLGRYGSLKDLSHRAKEVTQRLTSATSNAKKNKIQEPEKQTRIDVAAAPSKSLLSFSSC